MLRDWKDHLVDSAPNQNVAELVAGAIEQLLADDAYLFEVDANERSISHRLAIYLEALFQTWDVDCEFNRAGHGPKRLQLNPEQILSDDERGTTVYPDVIIHERGETGRNLLAIEIKKTGGGTEANDLRKLRALRVELGYELGLFVRFAVGAAGTGVEDVQWSVDAV